MLQTIDFNKFQIEPEEIVLDLGCGTGRHCFNHQIKKAKIIPLDKDPESMKEITKKIESSKTNKNEHFPIQGGAIKLPFKDRSFDKVICSEVLEHLPDPNSCLKEINRILKPNGEIAVSVPTYFTEIVIDRLADEYLGKKGGHIHVFKKEDLAKKIERNGFKIYSTDSAHSLHFIYWSLRAIFGIEEEENTIPKIYQNFLEKTYTSNFWKNVENNLNKAIPKSNVFYAEKRS